MFEDRRSGAEPGLLEDSLAATSAVLASPPRSNPRRRLLDAMVGAVAARGYDRTTVSRVLSSANVPEALFSEHFRDTHDCFMQAAEDLIGRVERSAIERFGQATPWPERVRQGLGDLLGALARDPDGAGVVFVEMLSAGPAACQRQRDALTLLASLLEEGRSLAADGEHLPAQTSEAIVGGIVSIVHRRVLQGNVTELPALHADLTYFALLPYLDHERALKIAGLEET
jgi:AcrR family transcriptional regulator